MLDNNSMVFTRLLPPCTQPCICIKQGVNKVEISIWVALQKPILLQCKIS